jgi:spermidine synthase
MLCQPKTDHAHDPAENLTDDGRRVLYDAAGRVRWITVCENAATRYLLLDGCEEGAMSLHDEAPVFNYLWFHKCSHLATHGVGRALVLGAGAFTAAKCLALDHPGAMIATVDEEADLDSVGRRFFGMDQPAFRNIRFHGEAAETYLTKTHQKYDFIFDDLFDGFQHVPKAGRGMEHVDRLRSVLSDGGVCIKNVIWSPTRADTRAAYDDTSAAWARRFAVRAVVVLGDPTGGHNRILIGWADAKSTDWPPALVRLAEMGVPMHVLAGSNLHFNL